jgi:putative FmdB family regulatory protein
MPVYDYKCTECNETYDIFHKGSEIAADVICPHCGSGDHKRLISAPSISMGSVSSGSDGPVCGSGCCGDGCPV